MASASYPAAIVRLVEESIARIRPGTRLPTDAERQPGQAMSISEFTSPNQGAAADEDEAVMEILKKHIAPKCVFQGLNVNGHTAVGPKDYFAAAKRLHTSIPDLTSSLTGLAAVEEQEAAGADADWQPSQQLVQQRGSGRVVVYARWHHTGHLVGDLLGIQGSGQPIRLDGCLCYTLMKDQIVSGTLWWDLQNLYSQLGITAPIPGLCNIGTSADITAMMAAAGSKIKAGLGAFVSALQEGKQGQQPS